MNEMSASVEYRCRTVTSRPPSRVRRAITSVTSPPSQIAANSTCNPKEVTAASWPAASALCPCCAIGMIAAIASAATKIRAVWLRTAKQRTVTAAAMSVMPSHACPSETLEMNELSPLLNVWSNDQGTFATLTKVNRPVVALATVMTAAEPAAKSSESPNSRRSGLNAKHASTRAPMRPGGAQVDDERGRREPPAHQGARIGEQGSRRPAAERECRQHRQNGDDQQHGGAGDPGDTGHRPSLRPWRWEAAHRLRQGTARGRRRNAAPPSDTLRMTT